MTSKKTTLGELGEMLSHVVKHITEMREEMATKEDLEKLETKFTTKLTAFQAETAENFRSFREETAENFRDVRAEIADIRRIAEDLQTRVGNAEGYSREIDHLIERIRVIEKHLGIEPQIAA
jgi:archaellum component FlaC